MKFYKLMMNIANLKKEFKIIKMEISDVVNEKKSWDVRIDDKGRFILPKPLYDSLNNVKNSNFFMISYNWDTREFDVCTSKYYIDHAKSLDSNSSRLFCSSHFGTFLAKGRRLNLSSSINPDYCKIINRNRPEIEGKSAKVTYSELGVVKGFVVSLDF